MLFKIPLYKPSLSGNERKYVNECLESTWISSKGKFVPIFEEKFAEYVGARYAASVCNGTVALHAALLALGIVPGDEVIVPTLTYVASVNAIAYTGATPVFVDSLPDTLQMDPEDVRRKLTPKTKALLVVHLYGHPCDMDALIGIARDHNLFVVEDCAEAIGTRYKGRHAGTFGDVATFSFFGNKTITTGEGGMVVTNDASLYNKIGRLKGQGLMPGREYWHDIIGYNYRMTNICAAIGLAQMERIDEIIEKKRRIAMWYRDALKGIKGIRFFDEIGDVVNSFWMCSVILATAQQRDKVRKVLTDAGVETRPFFHPVHTMPMYRVDGQIFPIAESFALRGINLPSYPALTNADAFDVIHIIEGASDGSA